VRCRGGGAHPQLRSEAAKRLGFTLAEVLITLGIIGVVAAMTLPTLISKYQMKVFETAFKKEYSVIQNTIDFLTTEQAINGCYVFYDVTENGARYSAVTNDCKFIKSELISKLKLQKLQNDFYRLYASKEEILASGGKTLNDSVSYDSQIRSSSAYLLPDGAVILMTTPEESTTPSYYNVAVTLDVNGKKGPNKWGYDVFYMVFSKHDRSGKIQLADKYASLVEKGGRLPRTILRNEQENSDFRY